jgi:hypothetical protein
MLVIAPFVSIVVMHMFRMLKKDMSYSERFMYRIRSVQGSLFSGTGNYHRTADAVAYDPLSGQEKRKESEKLKNLY